MLRCPEYPGLISPMGWRRLRAEGSRGESHERWGEKQEGGEIRWIAKVRDGFRLLSENISCNMLSAPKET